MKVSAHVATELVESIAHVGRGTAELAGASASVLEELRTLATGRRAIFEEFMSLGAGTGVVPTPYVDLVERTERVFRDAGPPFFARPLLASEGRLTLARAEESTRAAKAALRQASDSHASAATIDSLSGVHELRLRTLENFRAVLGHEAITPDAAPGEVAHLSTLLTSARADEQAAMLSFLTRPSEALLFEVVSESLRIKDADVVLAHALRNMPT